MKKVLSLFALILISSVLIFTACGDPYAGLSISANTSELQFVLDENDEAAAATFTAKVDGGANGISRRVSAKVEPMGVATATVSYANGTNTVTVTPIKGGNAKVVLTTLEGGVSKALVNVKVVKPIKGLAFNSIPLSIQVGGTLLFSPDNFIFTPSNTTQQDVEYSIKDAALHPGLNIAGNKLSATGTATCGLVTIVAKSKAITSAMTTEQIEALSTETSVLVYEGFSASDIVVKAGGSEINQITLAKNTIYQNTLEIVVEVNTTQTITTSAVVANQSIAAAEEVIGSFIPHAFNIYSVDEGRTQLVISVYVVGPDGTVYDVIQRTLGLAVVDAVEKVNLTDIDGTTSDTNISLKVYTAYGSGVTGTQLTVSPWPSTATDKKFVVNLVSIDGVTVTDPTTAGIQVFAVTATNPSGKQIVFGEEEIAGGTMLYIKVAQGFGGAKFLLEFKSNLGLVGNEVSNYAQFTVVEGINGIALSDDLNVGSAAQTELVFSLNYTTATGSGTSTDGLQNFSVTIANKDFATVDSLGNGTYKLVGKHPGATTIKVTAGNGYTATFTVNVLLEASGMGLSVPTSESKIVNIVQHGSGQVDTSGTVIYGATTIDVEVGASFMLGLVSTPSNASVFLNSFTSSAAGIVSITPQTGHISAYSTGQATITVDFTIVKLEGGVWVRHNLTRTILINVFRPITTFTITSQSASVLYDANSLNYSEISKSSAALVAQVLPTTSTFKAADIVWTSSEPTIITIVDQGNGRITVNAAFPGTYIYSVPKSVTITGTITEYGRQLTVLAYVTVVKPVLVNGIEVEDYNNAAGIYIENRDVANAQNRKQFEIKASVLPANAGNKKLVYAVYHAAVDGFGSVLRDAYGNLIAGVPYAETDPDAVVQYVYDNILGMAVLDTNSGNPIVKPITGMSGYFVIKIIPADQFTESALLDSSFTPSVYRELWGGVANGREVSYRIFTVLDLVSIGASIENLGANYTLMNDIDQIGRAHV